MIPLKDPFTLPPWKFPPIEYSEVRVNGPNAKDSDWSGENRGKAPTAMWVGLAVNPSIFHPSKSFLFENQLPSYIVEIEVWWMTGGLDPSLVSTSTLPLFILRAKWGPPEVLYYYKSEI